MTEPQKGYDGVMSYLAGDTRKWGEWVSYRFEPEVL